MTVRWSIPTIPMAEQATDRGIPVPVGRSAHDLRLDGWLIDDHILADAVLEIDPRSPTGYWWRGAYNREYAFAVAT